MEIISLIISLGAIGFTIYVYFAHNKQLNEQQEKLNAQQTQLNEQQKQLNTMALEKAKQEAIDSKCAKIFLNVDKNCNPHKLIITNNGKSTAHNITITGDKHKDPLSYCNQSPSWPELKPGQSLEQPIIISYLTASQVHYTIAWIDDNGEHSDSQVVYY